jgi:hypothetical protein
VTPRMSRPSEAFERYEPEAAAPRLAAIENRHKILDKKEDQNKPSLRRTSSTEKNGKDDQGNDDDRPTLKRRDDSN